jgi:hypothetical protein
VKGTIVDFGRCVDDIEDGTFSPPPPDKLGRPFGVRRQKSLRAGSGEGAPPGPTFAQVHCRNCDARFSCRSFRAYQRDQTRHVRGRKPLAVRDEEAERELDAWIEDNLSDD